MKINKLNTQMKKTKPNIISIDHIGITVPSADEASQWFVEVLDARILYTRGPYSAEDDWMKISVNVHPRSVIRKLKLLEFGNGTRVELLEYESPSQNQPDPNNADWNAHHIAFLVEDVITVKKNLITHNVQFYGDTNLAVDKVGPGLEWIYFRAPWGLQLELIHYF